MKKLLMIIPVILVLLISCIPLTSSAVTLTEDNADVFDNPEEYPNESWPAIRDYYNNSEHYLFFFYKDGNNHCFYLSDIDYFYQYANVEETSSTITISFDVPSGTNNPHWYDRYNWTDGFRANQLNFDTYDNSPIVYDKSNKTLTWGTRFTNLPVLKFESDLIDNGSSGGLEVSFLPIDLSGTINDTYKVGSVDAKLLQIDMEINNTTNHNYQFIWSIVPHDDSLTFENSNTDCLTKGYSGSPSWVYLSDEWIICPNPDTSEHGLIHNAFKTSAWHLSNAHSVDSFQTSIETMDLVHGVQYDCIVYAVESESDRLTLCDINLGITYGNLYWIDYTEVQEIYKSTFTLGFDTPFDAHYNSAGLHSFDPHGSDIDNFGAELARYNPDTGALEVGSNMYSGKGAGYYNSTSSGGSSNNTRLMSFTSAFSTVFGFTSAFFNHLPDVLQQLFVFGFSTLVVCGIVKAVI